MFKKFDEPLWYTYLHWPNIIAGIDNCPVSETSSANRNQHCRDQLHCALAAADAYQHTQFSSAATILGLVRLSVLDGSGYSDNVVGAATDRPRNDGDLHQRPLIHSPLLPTPCLFSPSATPPPSAPALPLDAPSPIRRKSSAATSESFSPVAASAQPAPLAIDRCSPSLPVDFVSQTPKLISSTTSSYIYTRQASWQ